MLAGLLASLAAAGLKARLSARYARYLRGLAKWCKAHELAALPTPVEVIRRYLCDRVRNLSHLRALDLAYASQGHERLSDRADLAEVIALLGLRQRHRLKPLQLAPATQNAYRRRINRFARWCAREKAVPDMANAERWLDTVGARGVTRHQYRSALRAWSKIPAAPAPPVKPAPKPAVPPPLPPPPPAAASGAQPGPKQRRSPRRPLRLRTAEERLLYQLSRTGVAEHHRHAVGHAKVRRDRLKVLLKAGYIQEHRGIFSLRRGRPVQCVRYYSLDTRGRAWLRRMGVKTVYRWNPQQLRHDLYLTEAYCQLPARVQRSWITETEIIAQLQAQGRYRPGEAVDAAVMLNGRPYAIEIAIGYSRAALAKKQACIRNVFGGHGMLLT